jgi:hypothetical protein
MAVRLTSAAIFYERIFNRPRVGRPLVNFRSIRQAQNSPRTNRRNPHTRRALDPSAGQFCPPVRSDFFTHPHHRIQLHHNLIMTQATNVSTRPATISGVLTSAGKYLTSLASNQLDQAGPEVSELPFVLGGIHHRFLSIKIQPFRGKFSAVLPLTRSALVSWQSGNEDHAQRLLSSVRAAMIDRDPQAADRVIRALGGEGFSVEVVGA